MGPIHAENAPLREQSVIVPNDQVLDSIRAELEIAIRMGQPKRIRSCEDAMCSLLSPLADPIGVPSYRSLVPESDFLHQPQTLDELNGEQDSLNPVELIQHMRELKNLDRIEQDFDTLDLMSVIEQTEQLTAVIETHKLTSWYPTLRRVQAKILLEGEKDPARFITHPMLRDACFNFFKSFMTTIDPNDPLFFKIRKGEAHEAKTALDVFESRYRNRPNEDSRADLHTAIALAVEIFKPVTGAGKARARLLSRNLVESAAIDFWEKRFFLAYHKAMSSVLLADPNTSSPAEVVWAAAQLVLEEIAGDPFFGTSEVREAHEEHWLDGLVEKLTRGRGKATAS